MKKNYKLFFIFVFGLFFMFSGCDSPTGDNNSKDTNIKNDIDNSKVNKTYKDIENSAFEEIVKGKTYYSKWFPTMQDTLEFDTDKNIVTYTQYYDSNYSAPIESTEPPKDSFDFKYIRKSKYLFTEDLKDMATVTLEHYKTRMNGSQREDFNDFTSEPSPLLFSKLRDDGAIIKWGYENFYTAEAMDELGFDNYILHPELIGPKK